MKKPLKAALDPHHIFLHAFYFHESNIRLRNSISPTNDNEVILVAHPSMVLCAFAIELYLKCLLCIETKKVPQEHNLKSLFLRLDLSTRRSLEALWDQDIGRPERQREINCIRTLPEGDRLQLDLLYALDAGANAFTELRYLYERKRSYFILHSFPGMLQKVILERFPCWKFAPPTQPIVRAH
jgi:hypothetical protein